MELKVSHCKTPELRRETSMLHRGILMSNHGQQRLNVTRTPAAKAELLREYNVIVAALLNAHTNIVINDSTDNLTPKKRKEKNGKKKAKQKNET